MDWIKQAAAANVKVLVFTETKVVPMRLPELHCGQIAAAAIHGDIELRVRDRTLAEFRSDRDTADTTKLDSVYGCRFSPMDGIMRDKKQTLKAYEATSERCERSALRPGDNVDMKAML